MTRALLLIVSLLVAGLATAGTTRDPAMHFFDDTFGDFSEELQRARDEGKRGILLFFEMDECPFCHRMKETVLNQIVVQDFYKEHFLIFRVDIEGDIEMTDFKGVDVTQKDFSIKQNRVRLTPVFQFYDLNGEAVVRFSGAASGVDEFLLLGEYAAEGVYKEMPFTRYKRMRRTQARP